MEIHRALSIFRLHGRVPMDKLNGVFRELVKKYHPDKILEYPEWAHERMSEINDAYETLAAWMPKAAEQNQEKKNVYEPQAREAEQESDPEDTYRVRDIKPLKSEYHRAFYNGFNLFLDGLGVYYQYGLENPAYRNEGTRRFRLRESLRLCSRGRDELQVIMENYRHPVVDAALRFARLSVADIDMGNLPLEPNPSFRKIDSRFKSAKRLFDDAVKEIFFPDMVPRHIRGRSPAGLYSSYTVFVLYLAIVPEGRRRDAAILMTSRYDSLLNLMELRGEGLLSF